MDGKEKNNKSSIRSMCIKIVHTIFFNAFEWQKPFVFQ